MTTALVFIDVQAGILQGIGVRRAEQDRALDAVVQRLAGVLALARAQGVPVVHVQHSGGPGHRLERGMPGWKLRVELAPRPEEPVVHKRSSDSFHETDLRARLEALRADTLVIGGCMTQFCVDTTCRRAVTEGFDVLLLRDGHMTADNGVMPFEQIIAHHNATLDGFDASGREVSLVGCGEVFRGKAP